MHHLFKRVYLEPISRLDERHDRILVSRDVSDEYFGSGRETLSRLLDIGDYSRTIQHTRRINWFIKEGFLYNLKKLENGERKTLIFCDEEAYFKLFTLWTLSLFPSLSFEEFRKLYLILSIDQLAVDRHFKWNGPYCNDQTIRLLYDGHVRQPELEAFIARNKEEMSLEYRLLNYRLTDEVSSSTANTIRGLLEKSFSQLNGFLKQQLLLSAFADDPAVTDDRYHIEHIGVRSPVTYLDGLTILNHPTEFHKKYIATDDRDTFITTLKNELELLAVTEANTIIRMLEIYVMTDPSDLMKSFIELIRQHPKPYPLLPQIKYDHYSFNRLSWFSNVSLTTTSLRPVWQ